MSYKQAKVLELLLFSTKSIEILIRKFIIQFYHSYRRVINKSMKLIMSDMFSINQHSDMCSVLKFIKYE